MTWREDLAAAVAQIEDPATRALAARTLERGAELAIRAVAGDEQAAQDLLVVQATAMTLPNAVRHQIAWRIEDAARRQFRQLLWGTLLGLPVP